MKYYMNYSGEERILEIKTLILFICDILLYTFKTCGQNFAAISQCLELRVNRVLGKDLPMRSPSKTSIMSTGGLSKKRKSAFRLRLILAKPSAH